MRRDFSQGAISVQSGGRRGEGGGGEADGGFGGVVDGAVGAFDEGGVLGDGIFFCGSKKSSRGSKPGLLWMSTVNWKAGFSSSLSQ